MALAGIKVLDLSRILAGPYAAQMFADLGADVVKVENPDGGDDTRKWGPPFTKNADGSRGLMSAKPIARLCSFGIPPDSVIFLTTLAALEADNSQFDGKRKDRIGTSSV